MDQKMFCFQCEQTAKGIGCTGNAGVCGKSFEVAIDQDELTGALVGLSRTCKTAGRRSKRADELIVDSLFTCVTNVDFNELTVRALVEQVRAEKERFAAAAGISAADDLLLGTVWTDDEDIRSLKSLVLFGLRGMAAYAFHARILGRTDEGVQQFFVDALAALGETGSVDTLLPLVLKVGEVNYTVMAMLDEANTGTYGTPEPTEVSLTIEKGPFIVVTGHDLHDLELLLKQTEGTGVNVYTHGEMLPAHYYPAFKKYAHFAGNYGNAWWQQKEEFESFNGPILMTTNCIVPPKASYQDRIFTTAAVGFPGCPHIEEKDGRKDFSAVIELAKKCAPPKELEQGEIVGGFAHEQVFALADKVVDAVKSGAIKKFVVMAGCDGRHKTRNYYRDFAEALPKDTVILTAGCAKYKYIKLNLGDIGGIPRVLDAGQCNDSYSLALIALKLKEVFGLADVNELPVVYNIAWYEQKAVIVLLALLHLGVKNIHLGPTLPAFLSPNVANVLVETFGIGGITDVESDIKSMIG